MQGAPTARSAAGCLVASSPTQLAGAFRPASRSPRRSEPTKQRRERGRGPSTYRHVWRPRHYVMSRAQRPTSPSWLPARYRTCRLHTTAALQKGLGSRPFYPCVTGDVPIPCPLAKLSKLSKVLANMQEAAGADITQPQDYATPQRPLDRRVSAVQRGPHVVGAHRHRNAPPRQVDS